MKEGGGVGGGRASFAETVNSGRWPRRLLNNDVYSTLRAGDGAAAAERRPALMMAIVVQIL